MGPFLGDYGKIIVMCIERATVLQDNNTCITRVHSFRHKFLILFCSLKLGPVLIWCLIFLSVLMLRSPVTIWPNRKADELHLQVVQSLLHRLMLSVTFIKLKTVGPYYIWKKQLGVQTLGLCP